MNRPAAVGVHERVDYGIFASDGFQVRLSGDPLRAAELGH